MNLPEWLQLVALTALAGAAIPAGGMLAAVDGILPRWLEAEFRHTIIAAGGGVLLAAVALVLVPEGAERTGPLVAAGSLLAGGLAALLVDRVVARHGGRFGMFMAMLLDYLPESLAVGALFAGPDESAALLAVLIAIQNLPEGFNAKRELVNAGMSKPRALALFALLVPLGPLMALAGWRVLADVPVLIGVVLLFAAGGILYLTFQDIAPQVPQRRRWGPPLGAVLGFMIGLTGHMLLT